MKRHTFCTLLAYETTRMQSLRAGSTAHVRSHGNRHTFVNIDQPVQTQMNYIKAGAVLS